MPEFSCSHFMEITEFVISPVFLLRSNSTAYMWLILFVLDAGKWDRLHTIVRSYNLQGEVPNRYDSLGRGQTQKEPRIFL